MLIRWWILLVSDRDPSDASVGNDSLFAYWLLYSLLTSLFCLSSFCIKVLCNSYLSKHQNFYVIGKSWQSLFGQLTEFLDAIALLLVGPSFIVGYIIPYALWNPWLNSFKVNDLTQFFMREWIFLGAGGQNIRDGDLMGRLWKPYWLARVQLHQGKLQIYKLQNLKVASHPYILSCRPYWSWFHGWIKWSIRWKVAACLFTLNTHSAIIVHPTVSSIWDVFRTLQMNA